VRLQSPVPVGRRVRRLMTFGNLMVVLILLCGGMARTGVAKAQAEPSIDYPDFSSTSGLTMNGASQQAEGRVLRLTHNANDLRGSAWAQVSIDPRHPFSTSFHASIHGGSGDGIAFVIQSEGLDALGRDGGGIGSGPRRSRDSSRLSGRHT
jgi:hypothetical protein